MKQIFKTTLLAASMAAAFGVAAGTVKVKTQTHSIEGLAGVSATAVTDSEAVTYVLGASYLEGDKVTFTFDKPVLKGLTFAQDVTFAPVNDDDITKAVAGLTMSVSAKTDTTVTYRVTTVKQATKVNGDAHDKSTGTTGLTIYPLVVGEDNGVIPYLTSSVVGGATLSVTVDSKDAIGDVIDNIGTQTGKIAQSKSQFDGGKFTPAGFDAIIDVAELRKLFVGGGTDTSSWVYSPVDTTDWLNVADVDSTTATVYGEKGSFDNLTASEFSSLQGGTETFNAADASVSYKYTGMVTNDTVTFTAATGDKAVALESQSFSIDFDAAYTSKAGSKDSASLAKNVEFGEWKLNGATVNIPYMPYGPNASQIIYVSNSGSQDGDISVEVFDDKGTYYDLGVLQLKAGKNRVSKVAPEINDRLRAKGFNGTKASITITVNAPESDITVYASYNVGGADRGYINTDQYKGK